MSRVVARLLEAGGDAIVPLRPFLAASADEGGVVVDAMNQVRSGAPRWGAPWAVTDAVVEALAGAGRALEAAGAWVEAVRIPNQKLGAKPLEQIVGAPWFGRVRDLDVAGNRVGAKVLRTLAKSGTSLETLRLDHTKVAKHLPKLAGLPALRKLSVRHCGMEAATLRALVDTPLPSLSELDLRGFGSSGSAAQLRRKIVDGHFTPGLLDAEALAPLLEPDHAPRWRALTFGLCFLRDDGAEAFAGAALPNLRSLWWHDVRMSREAAAAVVAADMPNLRFLRRNGGFPSDALLDAAFLPELERLWFDGGEWLDDAGAAAILERARALSSLRLTAAGLGSRSAEALASSAAPLTQVRVMNNDLRDPDIETLLRAPWIADARALGLSGNELGPTAIRLLAGANLVNCGVGLARCELDDDELAPLFGAPWLRTCPTLALDANRLTDASVDALIGLPLPEDARLFVGGNALSRAGAQRLSAAYGERVPNVVRQYEHKARQVRAPRVEGRGGVKLQHLGDYEPKPRPPLPTHEGIELLPGDSLRHFVGVQGGALGVYTVRDDEITPWSTSEPLPAPADGQVRYAAGVLSPECIALASTEGVFVVAQEDGRVQPLGDVIGEAWAIATNNHRVVVVDGERASKRRRVRVWTMRPRGDATWAWVLDDAAEIEGSFETAALIYGAPAIVLGAARGQTGDVAIIGVAESDQDGPDPARLGLIGWLRGAFAIGGTSYHGVVRRGEHWFKVASVSGAVARLMAEPAKVRAWP